MQDSDFEMFSVKKKIVIVRKILWMKPNKLMKIVFLKQYLLTLHFSVYAHIRWPPHFILSRIFRFIFHFRLYVES